jgi:murein L,D-transpeptidase YcbB/YkuD
MDNFYSLQKFLCWALCIFIFASCQKNITQITPTVVQHAPDTIKVTLTPGKSLSFDSLFFSNHRIPIVTFHDQFLKEKIDDKVTQFYKANGYQTKWLTENMPGYLFNTLEKLIHQATDLGLQPDDYAIDLIEDKLAAIYSNNPIMNADVIALDIQISEMFFLFSTHLREGKIKNLTAVGKAVWIREPKQYMINDVQLLLHANESEQLIGVTKILQPANRQYASLQKALIQYRSLEINNTSLIAIASKEKIKPNDRHAMIPSIRRRLALEELKEIYQPVDSCLQTDSLLYDQALSNLIKNFQSKNGLEPDGIVGEKTVKFLNQSLKEKADIIALNMERIKWQPDNYGDNYVVVNIPEYKLRLFQNQKKEFEMKVIVGSPDKPTPVFKDALEYIVFSPTWTVPTSILKEEVIPHLVRDSLHYADKNYLFYKNETVINPSAETWNIETTNPYQYRVVQQPGPDNALGLVKFIMPNHMNVYLHDTPNHSLFSKSYRALSHGCIRLSEPAKFAEYLLKNQKGWDAEAIDTAMHSTEPYRLLLKKRFEVQLEYRTAWVDENGEVNFREDIYGHDKTQLKQLLTKDLSPLAGI